MMNFNLDEIAQHLDVHIRSKSKEDPEDARLRRFKEKWLFIATLIALVVVFAVCVIFLACEPHSPYAGTALNGVIGLTMALAGYYVGGKTH